MKPSLYGTLILSLVTFCGCVSVSVATKKTIHAAGVKLTAPEAPFEKAESDNVDSIWRNPKNGNAISYLSDCSDDSDPPLTSIETGVLSGLYPYSYQTQEDTKFEGRSARRVRVRGNVDGVPSQVDLLIFKRNNCIYVVSYVGLEQNHPADQNRFEKFLAGFHAP